MPEKNNSANEGITQALDLKDIDPSPYQHRRHFEELMGDVHKIISYYQAVPLIGVK